MIRRKDDGPFILVLALLISAILFWGCAAVPGNVMDSGERETVGIVVTNGSFEPVTVYIAREGRIVRRVGSCPAIQRCRLGVTGPIAEQLRSEGVIEIGWRLGIRREQPGSSGYIRSLRTDYWGQVELRIEALNVWLIPFFPFERRSE